MINLMHDLFENESESSPRLHAAIKAHYRVFIEVEDCLARWSATQAAN